MSRSNKSNFIAIAGNIGVGKTTLSTLLKERFAWNVIYEPELKNPYLEDFYQDMLKWSFHSQLFFLTQRFKDHLKIQKSRKICVQDRTIYEDAEIFATNLYERELMHPRDYRSYCDLYETMLESLRKPGLVVYLKASSWTLLSRIRKRGRHYERNLDREYLAQLNINYEKWIRKISNDWNVLVIDTDNYDINQDKDWSQSILEEIKKHAKIG